MGHGTFPMICLHIVYAFIETSTFKSLFCSKFIHRNVNLYYFHKVQNIDTQISITTTATRTEGGLPVLIPAADFAGLSFYPLKICTGIK